MPFLWVPPMCCWPFHGIYVHPPLDLSRRRNCRPCVTNNLWQYAAEPYSPHHGISVSVNLLFLWSGWGWGRAIVWTDATDGEEQQRAPGTGTASYLWWPGGATSSFNSCPVCGQIYAVSVHLRRGLLAPFLSSHNLGISRVPHCVSSHFVSRDLDFQLCSLYFSARQSFGNRCTRGTLLTCLGRHRPVLCLHLIGQMHSLCFRLLACCP